MKHLFYNEYGMSGSSKYDYHYKNPLNVFGGESGKYTTLDFQTDGLDQNDNGERRILKDDVMVLEIPSDVFGEKVKPNSFKIKDYSSDESITKIVETTAGRSVLAELLPREIPFSYINKDLDKKAISELFDATYRVAG